MYASPEEEERFYSAHPDLDPGPGPFADLPPADDERQTRLHSVDAGAAADGNEKEGERPPGLSWLPRPTGPTLDALLAGTLATPKPTVGAVNGGAPLFYRGAVNGVAGESGAAKTWTILASGAQELAIGERFWFVDYESSLPDILGRLLLLGADPEALRERFTYIQPEIKMDGTARALLVEGLGRHRPTLVGIDSTGEALATEGARPNEDDEVARWFQNTARVLARVSYDDAPGPAVVLADHVAKVEGGLWPIGSQRKRAAITGAQYIQTIETPFSRTSPGASLLTCAKDRNGFYSHGQRVARLVIDHPDETHTTFELEVPKGGGQQGYDGPKPELLIKIQAAIKTAGRALSATKIEAIVGGRSTTTRTAIAWLSVKGYLSEDTPYDVLREWSPDDEMEDE